jgi:hypothetical protein
MRVTLRMRQEKRIQKKMSKREGRSVREQKRKRNLLRQRRRSLVRSVPPPLLFLCGHTMTCELAPLEALA